MMAFLGQELPSVWDYEFTVYEKIDFRDPYSRPNLNHKNGFVNSEKTDNTDQCTTNLPDNSTTIITSHLRDAIQA